MRYEPRQRRHSTVPWWALGAFVLCAACVPDTPGDAAVADTTPPEPPIECRPLWETEVARAVVDTLVRATQPGDPVWVDYQASQSAFVLHAGTEEGGGECVGLFREGAPVGFASLPESARLQTPLYGYYFSYEARGGPMEGLAASSEQPESVRRWLSDSGIRSAVILPIVPVDFPMDLPAVVTTQLAVHEAFHVDVQAPVWMGHPGDWPEWDVQPDRAGLRECYSATAQVAEAFQSEREALASAVGSLLDGATGPACQMSAEFLSARALRHDLLSDVTVELGDGSMGTCSTAEAIMELEEGTADFVSWVRLFDTGLVGREQLFRRYGAIQQDAFYLTGAMKLHASVLLRGGGADETRTIARSPSWEIGSPQARLEAALGEVCSEQ